MKTQKSIRPMQAGVTLVEMLIVLAIILTIVAAGVPAYQYAKQRSEVASILRAKTNAATSIAMLRDKPGFGGLLPITEGGVPPVTANVTNPGAAGGSAANAATLETVLITEGVQESPFQISAGTDSPPTNSSAAALLWSIADQAFTMTPAAEPTQNYSATRALECRASNQTPDPSLAAGANFWLNGSTDLDANVRVVYWRIPGVSASTARATAKAANQNGNIPDVGLANNSGPVVYDAAVNGATTLYVYVAHF